jgi:hypothetical protein
MADMRVVKTRQKVPYDAVLTPGTSAGIGREQDEMDGALHDVRVAAGEGDDRDAERHVQQPFVRVLHAQD